MKNQTFLKMKRLIDIINTDNEPNIINDMVFGDNNLKNNNMKQTAVEWLVEQLSPSISLQQKHIDRYKILAIEMEKNQIINTFKDAQVFKFMNDETRAEQYYNQLYGK
jgi:hypothetical protein